MEEINEKIAHRVIEFVEDSIRQMYLTGHYRKDKLRLAIPDFLVRHITEGMATLYHGGVIGSEVQELCGVTVHPTWENAVTLYHIDGPVNTNTPYYKLVFTTEYEGEYVSVDVIGEFDPDVDVFIKGRKIEGIKGVVFKEKDTNN